MASIKITQQDTAALPTGLLALAKAHMRVDANYDDAYITSTITRAINWFQRYTNVTVDPTTYAWTPDAANFCENVARFTETPVANLSAKIGAADVTANYSVTTMSTHGVGIYALNGAPADGLVLTFQSGYATAAVLPAGILDALLRYAAHLYEHREILVPDAQAATPGWLTDVIATYWMPRA